MEEIQFYLDEAKESMEKALSHTEREFSKIRAGKASPAMLQGLSVDYYGAMTPVDQVASINTPDAKTIIIKPWEKAVLSPIETAIINSDLGLNPQNDGELIRLSIPTLTEERRRDLVKQAKGEAENGKVRIRNIRKDSNAELKKLLKDGASEDAIKGAEDEIQKLTDAYIVKIDDVFALKEKDIMKV